MAARADGSVSDVGFPRLSSRYIAKATSGPDEFYAYLTACRSPVPEVGGIDQYVNGMAGMLRVKTKWTGFSGAPGYSNFYFRDFTAGGEPTPTQAAQAVDRVNTFWSNIQGRLPAVVSLSIQGDVEVIEATNGQMQTVYNVTAPAAKIGENTTSTFSGPTGAVINWRTAGVRNGRRVRGRTFIVPIATSCYQNDGTLDPTHHNALGIAAATLTNPTGTPDLGVWARPTAPGAEDGVWYAAESASVPDMAAVLRSRRD